MSDATTTTTAPAAPPPTAPLPAEPSAPAAAPASEANRIAAAMAIATEASRPAPEPQESAQPPAPERPAVEAKRDAQPDTSAEAKAEAATDDKVPTLAELQAEIFRRQQRQQAPQEPEYPPQPQTTEQRAEDRKIETAISSISVTDFQRDPYGAMLGAGLNPREIMRAMASRVLGGQAPEQPKTEIDQAAIDKLIEQKLDTRWRAAEQQRQAAEAQRTAYETQQRAEHDFIVLATDAAKYTMLSRLPPEEIVWYGNRVADQYAAAGRPATFDQIAKTIELTLAERFGAVGSPGSTGHNPVAAGDEKQAPSGPQTLSQSLPAQPSSGRLLTEEERIAAAIKIAEAGD